MSCRVLGKGIENEFLNNFVNILFKKGIENVKATYINSPKNIQTKEFYSNNGFTLIQEDKNTRTYQLTNKVYKFVPSKIFKTKIK